MQIRYLSPIAHPTPCLSSSKQSNLFPLSPQLRSALRWFDARSRGPRALQARRGGGEMGFVRGWVAGHAAAR